VSAFRQTATRCKGSEYFAVTHRPVSQELRNIAPCPIQQEHRFATREQYTPLDLGHTSFWVQTVPSRSNVWGTNRYFRSIETSTKNSTAHNNEPGQTHTPQATHYKNTRRTRYRSQYTRTTLTGIPFQTLSGPLHIRQCFGHKAYRGTVHMQGLFPSFFVGRSRDRARPQQQ